MLKFNNDTIVETAIQSLLSVARDSKAPAAARAAASRTLLETVGKIGRLQTEAPSEARNLSEMDAGALETEIIRLRALLYPSEPEAPDPFSDV
jgi:hypothetical protein